MNVKAKRGELTLTEYVRNSTPENLIDIQVVKKKAQRLNSEYERFLAWLLMLEIYPNCFTDWPSVLGQIYSTYFGFVKDFGIEDWEKKIIPSHFPSEAFGLGKNSIMAVIHGDLVRTGRILNNLKLQRIIPGSKQESEDDKIYFIQEHVRRLERALYIFALVNPGYGYLQGFNELIAPFYYVSLAALEECQNNLNFIEALSFQMFLQIMTKSRLNEFYTTQDKSSIILHQLLPFLELQKAHIPEQAHIIEKLNIHPIFYCLRWFALLFAQEYDFFDLLIVWDVLFQHFSEIMEYSFYIGIAQIYYARKSLDKNNYQKTIQALQKLKIGSNTSIILDMARKYWEADQELTFDNFFQKISDFFS